MIDIEPGRFEEMVSEREVTEQVRRTVIHEIGHHFGIDDNRLRELGPSRA